MSKKTIIVLIVLTVLAAISASIALKQEKKVEQASAEVGVKLLPEVSAKINDIDQIKVSRANNEVIAEYRKSENGWVAAHKSNYPVAIEEVRKFLIAVSEAKTTEKKTKSKAFYSKLHLQDVENASSKAMRAELFTGESKVADLHIGKRGDATRSEQQFVRVTYDAQSWMIAPNLPVAEASTAWLIKDLVDISSKDICKVEVSPADSAPYVIEKSERTDANFAVSPIPEGKELSSDSVANPIASVLNKFKIEDIPEQSLTVLEEGASKVVYTTFDGVTVTVLSKKDGDTVYARFAAAFDEAAATKFATVESTNADASTEPSDDEPTEESKPAADTSVENTPDFSEAQADVDALAAKFSDWLFIMPVYKHTNMVKTLDSLVKDIETDTEDESATE